MQTAIMNQKGCSSATDGTTSDLVRNIQITNLNHQLTVDQKIVTLDQAIQSHVSKTARNDNSTEEKKGVQTLTSLQEEQDRANSECLNSDSQSSGNEDDDGLQSS